MDELCATSMTDKDMAATMQRNNYEKFKTLVRMHLSFELDLNTDEFDLPCHEVIFYEKGKLRKWNRLSKKTKSCTSVKTTHSPPEVNPLVLNKRLIKQFKQLKMLILLDKNVNQEGIFRKTGSVSRQSELRAAVLNDNHVDINSGYTVHDCATVFKSLLADLHEPVLTDAHYPAHCQIAPLCSANENDSKESTENQKKLHLLSSMQLLLLLLPAENRALLYEIIEMLHIVASHVDKNKMSSENLATMFTPHLICPRNLPPEALHYVAQTMSVIITYMITKGLVIFEIPAKLATDIRAYFLERKRKKTMSPEQTLDESISDISTVNTVYTFVDREKTAAAHNANNTDTELAQLYAHIQSLPESSKKRRLIKQFNKQNGQGTPLQLVTMNRIKNSETSRSAKSISDSIKKHIFHKSIITRTPKRSAASMIHHASPLYSTKNPKLRVLFQSPIANSSSIHNTSAISSNSSSSNTFLKKTHPLHKSVSSTSLLLTCRDHTSPTKSTTSVSSPVSRPTSRELESGYCETPMNSLLHSSIIKDSTLSTVLFDKKSVAWKNSDLENVPKITYPTNPIEGNQIEFQSRYKSEPNLSQMSTEPFIEGTPICKSKSLTRKLIKGVSMGNLRSPFGTDLGRRSAYLDSSTKRQLNDERHHLQEEIEYELDDDVDLNGDKQEEYGSVLEVHDHCSTQRLSIYRNIDLITSTPSMLLGRRSMSPITKSTRKMPKAMQESIMTPRSRKPVMLGTTLGSSEQNQTFNQSNLTNLREQDEDSFVCHNPNDNLQPIMWDYPNGLQPSTTLSNDFKEYLLSRSVLTDGPVDLSFSSQPDDFGSTQDIEDLGESCLSSSLLYCLDGNQPMEETSENHGRPEYGNLTNRKLSATNVCDSNKENSNSNADNFLLTQNVFINEYECNSGETSF